MAFDENTLSNTYNITRLSIQSNTQISTKATSTISKLSSQSPPGKPILIILHAQSRWASKLISVVEIAKRDLETKGVKVFQYSALSSEIVEIERKPKPKAVSTAVTQDDEISGDEAFQTMGVSEEGGKKKRAVPVMRVYLATQSVKALRVEFGEQKSG